LRQARGLGRGLGSQGRSGGLVAGTAAAAPATRTADGDPVVRTAGGLVRGIVTDDHRIFQGIPYAAPPVGDLRPRAPRPGAGWDVFERGNALSLSSAAIAPVDVDREHQCGFWRSLTR
jgi:Carboxylesterase family